jgi:hypothetical protein
MSLMDLIHRAWKHACGILDKHDHKTRPPELDVLFMEEIDKLGRDTSYIVAMLYSHYTGTKSELDELRKERDQLRKRYDLNQRVKKHLKEEVQDLKRLDALSNHRSMDQLDQILALESELKSLENINATISTDLIDQRDDLQSSLNTSRFFIFMSGMCGFVLGLACLYLVV